jgi:hypothetical protein
MPAPSASERALIRGPATTRTFTRWTTDDLEIAEALTNGGSLHRAADLCWALIGDGRVRAALETRIKGLLKLPLAWEASGDGRSSGRVIKALEGGDFYKAHSEAALFSLGGWGTLLGIGLNQRVWALHGGRWLGVHKPYDVRNLRWDPAQRKWFVRTDAGEVEIVPGDRRWVLYSPYCSGTPDGDERPWMWGAWRACARPWLGKYFSWGDWQHHGEMHGSPIRTADVDGDATVQPKKLEELAEDLGDLGADTAIVPPKGVKLRLLEAIGKTWEMFPAAIDAASREVVIAITGQASSTEVQQGQETGATLHGQVRQDLIDGDARTLSTCLREQSLADYAALNFGSAELAPWPCWKTDPPVDIGAVGDAMKKLGDGMAALGPHAPEGERIDRRAVFERAGVPLEKIPPEVLAAQQAAADADAAAAAATPPDPNAPPTPAAPGDIDLRPVPTAAENHRNP